ncbi:MAG: sialidase family protein [Victivallaceae bacterium]|nr:sialidase family protein [Victivallaceae bacterium]
MLFPAKIEWNPGASCSEEIRLWQGCPSIAATGNGWLYVNWYSGGEKEPSEENYQLLVRSTDGGKSWSEPLLRVVSSKAHCLHIGDARCWLSPDGKLHFFWSQYQWKQSVFEPHCGMTVWQIICDEPEKPVLRWSEPSFVTRGNLQNAPVLLADGRIVLCAFNHTSRRYGFSVSEDGGETYRHVYGAKKIDTPCDESMIVEGKNHTLTMFARTAREYGKVAISRSTDGIVWSEAQFATGLVSPCTRFFIGKLRSGRWIMVNNDDPVRRRKLTIFLSGDEGKSWSSSLVIDERESTSYPDLIERGDGEIFVVYDWNRNTEKTILLARVSEAEILRGAISEKESFLGRVISAAPRRSDDKARFAAILEDYKEVERLWREYQSRRPPLLRPAGMVTAEEKPSIAARG